MTRPNTINTNYSYDGLSHLLSILHQVGATTIDGATYTYDNAGNRQTRQDNRTNVTTNYGYDNLYQSQRKLSSRAKRGTCCRFILHTITHCYPPTCFVSAHAFRRGKGCS
jgi:hypothetical protein